jgi:hypothetical protein
MDHTRWDHGLTVTGEGQGLIGHAGAVLLRKLADQAGLTAALGRSYEGFGTRVRGWPAVSPLGAGGCPGYFSASGIGAPMRSKAWRCSLVGSVSTGTAAGVPAKRTWLRVRVPRWASRPRKLR